MKEELFYPLYKDFDRKFFEKLKQAVQNEYAFMGSDTEKVRFIKDLFYFQLIKNYRKPLEIVFDHLGPEIDISAINGKMDSVDFTLDFSWISFKHERQMVTDAQKFRDLEVILRGSDTAYSEFVLRYLVSVWLADWEGPLFALLVETRSGELDLDKLNEILSLWDFTKIFLSE